MNLKIRAILFALFGLASLVHAFAQGSFSKDGFTYRIMQNDSCITVTGYNPDPNWDYSQPLHIPSSVTHNGKTYFVWCVGSEAFRGLTDIRSVVVDEGISVLGDYVFMSCTNLESISIPASVENIGKILFRNCYNLTSIVIDAKNESYDARDNSNAIIDSNSDELLVACSSTKVPSSVKSIGDCAFYGCGLIEELVIPEGVKKIDHEAFGGCSSLKSVSLPESLIELGANVFIGCNSLTSIVIPKNVIKIHKDNIFAGCNNLTSVVVDGANQIYDSRSNCNGIVRTSDSTLVATCCTTTIGEDVSSLGDYCFYGTVLHSLHIPKSVSKISEDSFERCVGIDTITVAEGNPNYMSLHGSNAILSKDGKTLVLGCRTTVIPDGVEEIGDGAFYGRYAKLVLRLPKTVKAIGYCAFSCCNDLCEVIIPKTVSSIGSMAFRGCENLAVVQILAPLKIISHGAFENCCRLYAVSLTEGTETIESYAFKGCKSLKHITLPSTVKNVDSRAFEGCPISEKQ